MERPWGIVAIAALVIVIGCGGVSGAKNTTGGASGGMTNGGNTGGNTSTGGGTTNGGSTNGSTNSGTNGGTNAGTDGGSGSTSASTDGGTTTAGSDGGTTTAGTGGGTTTAGTDGGTTSAGTDGGTTGSTTGTTDGGTTGSTTGTTGATTGSTDGGDTGSTTGTTGSSGGGLPDLGPNADMRGRRPFPDDNPWNTPIDKEPVDPNSAALIASIGLDDNLHPDFGANWNGGPFGIPYVVVSGSQAKVPVSFYYPDESDPGPYPIPSNPPIEPGGDRHILVVDRDNWRLYEVFDAERSGNGWACGSGAIWALNSNALRPAGWTSADAAGLPIFPGLVRYDEVEAGEIAHALRFTVSKTRRAYIHPARHFASSDTNPNLPPMGMRVRLKAGVNISGFSPRCQVILRALKKYGMMVADNGSDWFLSGTADSRWNDEEMNQLKQIRGNQFEVVKMGPLNGG